MPTTDPEIAYGTPEMANEIKQLLISTDDHQHQIIITAGHEEGIFTYGSSLTAAFDELMKFFDNPEEK